MESALVDHLADQLTLGRLGLFLGAGASAFYGLPSWKELLDSLYAGAGLPSLKDTDDLTTKAANLRATKFKGDPTRFKAAVKNALYAGRPRDFALIRRSDMLAAIGSLVMSSHRGSAAKVITLNYDDLLEAYLEYHGFTTATIWRGEHWARNDDVVIYHPHGFLPQEGGRDSDDIVLDVNDFHKIMNSPVWRPVLETALRQHTFLYIGLSGADMHLHSLWSDLSAHHAVSRERILYHGVRFAIQGRPDDMRPTLQDWGIHTHEIASHGDLPDLLFKICQRARAKRSTSEE